MSAPIDDFQGLLTSYFRELVLATAYLEIGRQATRQSAPTASISLTLADGITTEPMYLHELMPHSASVIFGIAELFQTKAVAAWSDLLNSLFGKFVESHMSGRHQFPAFKRRTTRIDFGSTEEMTGQVRAGLVADFAFSKYADRIQTIVRVLLPSETVSNELQVVRKHVQIRNSTQHHGGLVYDEMLRELGTSSLAVLDHNGQTISLSLARKIPLYVPELDRLKSAFFIITNEWRGQLAAYSNGSDT